MTEDFEHLVLISHTSGPKLSFGGNFQMILHGFVQRSEENNVFWTPRRKTIQNHLEITSKLRHAKFEQNSDFGHVRTYFWLHKLRNTQGKIYGTYLGKVYGIYKEYIRNIHKYLWYRIIRNKEHRPNGATASRPPHWGSRRMEPVLSAS